MANDFESTVLVVDSDQQTRVLTKQTLEQSGFLVSEAKHTAQALDLLSKKLPDVIIINVIQSRVDELSACRRIREHSEGCNKPILVIARHNDVDAIQRAYVAGATDILTMPCNPGVVGYRVRRLLGGYKAPQGWRNLGQSESQILDAGDITDEDVPQANCCPPVYAYGLQMVEKSSVCSRYKLDQSAEMSALIYAPPKKRRIGVPRKEKSMATATATKSRPTVEKVIKIGVRSTQRQGTHDIPVMVPNRKQVGNRTYYDSITGLPNEVLFKELLTSTLAFAGQRHKIALLLMDVDLCDYSSHKNCDNLRDQLLPGFAERLTRCMFRINRYDQNIAPCTIGCLGGGKFSIIMRDISGRKSAANVAVRTLRELSGPFRLENCDVSVAINIGISVYPDDGTDIFTLLSKSEMAMNRAKESGQNTYDLYETTASTSTIGYSTLVIT